MAILRLFLWRKLDLSPGIASEGDGVPLSGARAAAQAGQTVDALGEGRLRAPSDVFRGFRGT